MMRIEATFICRELPKDLAKQTHEKIEQGYLIDSVDPVRIRKKGSDYSLHVKLWSLQTISASETMLVFPLIRRNSKRFGN